MSRSRWFLVLLLLSLPTVLNAQTRIDAGIAIGLQSHESSSDSPRVLSSADVLARRGNIGAHLAVEYADLTQLGAMVATHLNLVYRHALGGHYAFLAGAGPTYVYNGEFDSETTWNAEAELARTWPRTDLFARVRWYDYSFERFRDRPASPNGPAVYLGVRFRLTQTP
jgi:hypothetical protein